MLIYERIMLLITIISVSLWKRLDAATSTVDEYNAVSDGISSLQASDVWSPSSNVVKTSGENTFNLSYNTFTNTSLSALNFPWADVQYIHHLDLSQNLITDASLECFDLVANQQWTLITLDLSYNQIADMSSFPYGKHNFAGMKKLNLANNYITQLAYPTNIDVLKKVASNFLEELNLENNQITEAPKLGITGFAAQPLVVNLKNNTISLIEDVSWTYLYFLLEALYFDNNQVSEASIPNFLEEFYEGVKYVYMSNNKFTNIPALPSLPGTNNYYILEMYFNNNEIISVDSNAFDNYAALQILDLRNNKLASFPFNNVFDYTKLGNLNTLLLQNNMLTAVGNESAQFTGARPNTLNMTVKGKHFSYLCLCASFRVFLNFTVFMSTNTHG